MSAHDHDGLVGAIEEAEQFLDRLAAKYADLDGEGLTVSIGDLVQIAFRIGDRLCRGSLIGYR